MKLLHRETTRTIWALAWPTVVHSFLQTFVGIVDTIMVGWLELGHLAISAVGMSQQIIFVVMIGALAVSTGSTTLVAQFYGAGRNDEVSRTVAQSLLMAAGMGLVATPLGMMLAQPLLTLLGSKGDVLEQGVAYMHIYFAGVFFMFFSFLSSAVLRGAGDTVTPLKISVVVNLINVVGNYLLIFGKFGFPKMGVAGAALATIIAMAAGAVMGLYVLFSGKFRVRLYLRDLREASASLMLRILRIGIPSGLQGIVRNGTRLVLFRIVADSAAGVAGIAALTIGFRVRMVTIMPALAIQVAAVALVGQYIGRKHIDEAEQVGREAIKLCTLILSGMGILQFALAPWLIRVFTDSKETIQIGAVMLRFFSVGQTFAAAGIAASGGLAGAGDTRPGLVYSAIGNCCVMLPLGYLLCRHTGLDLIGVWLAWTLSEILQFVLMFLRFRGGKWKTMKV